MLPPLISAIDLSGDHLSHSFALLDNERQVKHAWLWLRLVTTKSERNTAEARTGVVANQRSCKRG